VLLGLATLLLTVTGEPADPASHLLKEYLAYPTEHSTLEAARMWLREAKQLGIESAIWSVDPAGECVHFVAYLPATELISGQPILLLHHGDTAPTDDPSSSSSTFLPNWMKAQTDWELYGPGVLETKGPGVVQWMAFKSLLNKSRSRDLFFLMSCGSHDRSPYGIQAFFHFFVKNLPGMTYELQTLDKINTAQFINRFPKLHQIAFVWNSETFGNADWISPSRLALLATAEKGYWRGRISFEIPSEDTNGLAEKIWAHGSQKLIRENLSFSQKLHSLHTEMFDLAKIAGSTTAFWERMIISLYPRFFFEHRHLEKLVSSWWQEFSPLHESDGHSFGELEYYFLGDQTRPEIETKVRTSFSSNPFSKSLKLFVQTLEYSNFRRDFLEGIEAQVIKQILTNYSHVLVSPYIDPHVNDSHYFRQMGVKTYSFVPFFLTNAQMESLHTSGERLPHDQLTEAVEIETRILERLLK